MVDLILRLFDYILGCKIMKRLCTELLNTVSWFDLDFYPLAFSKTNFQKVF